jgi:hypothetical protein
VFVSVCRLSHACIKGMSFPSLVRLIDWYGVSSTVKMGKLAQDVNVPISGPDRKSIEKNQNFSTSSELIQ